jgi:hypothetical protein
MDMRSSVQENPFSVHRIRPGALSYVFPAEVSAETLVAQLRRAGWWGEIVGPHGSGKSTLLESLKAPIARAGYRTVSVALHDGQRRLPMAPDKDSRLAPPAILMIDGYEQLGGWSRFCVKRFCRRRGLGLLVTAHKSVGLHLLFRTTVSLDLAERVVASLLQGRERPFTAAEVSDSFRRCGGNLRESLFDLYDLFEQRRPSSGQNVT